MKAEKVYLSNKGTTVFKCPKCKTEKSVNFSKYKDLNNLFRFRVKCSCEHIYSVILEKRKHYRKNVNLLGHFMSCGPEKMFVNGAMIVKNISPAGSQIKFFASHKLPVGEDLSVEVHLDDKKRTLIKGEAVIRNISEDVAGVEFAPLNPLYSNDRAITHLAFPL